MAKADLTAARARELFHYDPETGVITRRVAKWGHPPGEICGCIHATGYWRINVDGCKYLSHRVIWLWVTGEWPNVIDHINGVRSDNRWTNLRNVTQKVNTENRNTVPTWSKSQLIGAQWNKQSSKWRAKIRSAGREYDLGLFETAQDAHEAYIYAKRQIHAGCTL